LRQTLKPTATKPEKRRFFSMPHTSDNDKKAQDNNALRHEKNMMREKNRKAGKHQYSKKTDHL
jgi:hypothetical protein